jgi:hypothetical protein
VTGQERREQYEQVQNGKREQAMRGAPIGSAAPAQLQREHDEDRSTDNGSHAIDRTGEPERPWQDRNRHQKKAIDEDLPRRFSPSGSMGTRAWAYSSMRLSDSAQKWGGVHRKTIKNKMNGSRPISPVAAAQPIIGGSAPAAPPITMFCGV